MRVKTGEIVVGNVAERFLSESDLNAALLRHRFGDPGYATSIRDTIANHPLFGEPSGFRSEHVDSNGNRFEVYTDLQGGKTHVGLI